MRVLLTGATGYIGKRLKLKLLESGDVTMLRLLVSDRRQVPEAAGGRVEIIEGNTFNAVSLKLALEGIDTAYYLIHSLRSTKGDFEELDRISAHNFIEECVRAGVKRVIYLGGLGEKNSSSRHLASRYETGEILSSHPERVETIWFRAAIIIGAGGASYEIIRNLVQKLPVMLTPAWVKTATQPVSVDDVMKYLAGALKKKFGGNRVIDIGGEKMSFLDMLKQAADVYGLRRVIIPVPFITPKVSSYWIILFTPVPYKLASALVAGLKCESVIKNSNAAEFFPEIKPVSYAESIRRATAEEDDEIISRWSDGSGAFFNSGRRAGEMESSTHRASYRRDIDGLDHKKIWESVVSIGGTRGWFSMDLLWSIRGLIDKLSGGAGRNRGRRSAGSLRIGDSLDFWRVVDLVQFRRLLLFAQMKLPGKGWLEFILNDREIIITAHFIPSGLYGIIYWYSLFPVHEVLFRRMIRRIIRGGKADEL